MRSLRVAKVTDDENSLTVTGQNDERLTVVALSESIIRVTMMPDGQPRLNRSWSVVGDAGEIPREGRARDDLMHAFPAAPAGVVKREEGFASLETSKLRVEILAVPGEHAALRWVSVEHEYEFAADRPRSAYMYDGGSGGTTVRHCE